MLLLRRIAIGFRQQHSPLLSLFRDENPLLQQRCLFSSPVQDDKEKKRIPVKFLKLNNLHDNPGAVKPYRRVGRGIGSSKGKTSGRGHKGQKARSGGSIPIWYEGGQTPLHKRLPKRGFKAVKKELVAVNLGTIQDYAEMGRIPGVGESENNPINMYHLIGAGILKSNTTLKRGGMKLLADGKERFTLPLHFLVGWASGEAIKTVEAAGGTVTTFHYNKRALLQLLRGKIKDRRARPPPKYQPYYTSWNKRGFLHPAIQLRKWFQKSHESLKTKFDELRQHQEEARSKAAGLND
ncbi:hypothetical protein ACA910_010692 [Epithemia clementina (nom. ined.)]